MSPTYLHAVVRMPRIRMGFAAFAGLVTFALLSLSGCSTTLPVNVHEAPGASVAERTTFFWQGGYLKSINAVDLATVQAADVGIRSSIIDALHARGYREVSLPEEADLLIGYRALVGPATVNTEKRFGGAAPATTAWPGDLDRSFASTAPARWITSSVEVSVAIDDRHSRRLLWRGVIVEDLRIVSTEEAIGRVVNMTGQIAKKLPARGPGLPAAQLHDRDTHVSR